MTVNKIFSALGGVTKRTVYLVFKLCGVFLTLMLRAAVTGTDQSDTETECPHDKETREYYEHAAATNFRDGC